MMKRPARNPAEGKKDTARPGDPSAAEKGVRGATARPGDAPAQLTQALAALATAPAQPLTQGVAALAAALPQPLTHDVAVLAAALPPEAPLRKNAVILKPVGPDVVPLSHRRYVPVWAFRLNDALAAAVNPAVTPAVGGTTRLTAETPAGDSELATFRNPGGLLIARTRTVADANPEDTTTFPISHLVTLIGTPLDPDQITRVRLENSGYQTVTYKKTELKDRGITNVWMAPPSDSSRPGTGALVIGQAPARLFKPGAEVRISAPLVAGAGAKTRLDGAFRFVLWDGADELFPGGASPSELRLEIDADQGHLALRYRVTRDDSNDLAGALPGANNTARTKLVALAPPNNSTVAAKDVPPLYLLLS